jgi:hypothetical protein
LFKRDDWIFGLISIVLACAVLYFSQELKGIRSMDPAGPAAMPIIIAWIMMGIGGVHVAGALRVIKKNPVGESKKKGGMYKVVLICVACIAYYLFLESVGYPVMTPLLIMSIMASVGVRSVKKLLGVSLGTTVVLFCVFYYALQVNMPLGILRPLFA